jgi:hypothetical protein
MQRNIKELRSYKERTHITESLKRWKKEANNLF